DIAISKSIERCSRSVGSTSRCSSPDARDQAQVRPRAQPQPRSVCRGDIRPMEATRTRSHNSNFDAIHPPEKKHIDECVHCGFCLPACPTYLLWGDEMDSPRGRIYLIKGAAEGQVPVEDR